MKSSSGLIVALAACFIVAAFGFKRHTAISRTSNICRSAEKKAGNSFFDFLSGKTLVEQEKSANPNLFKANDKPSKSTKQSLSSVKKTPSAINAFELFKKENPSPRPESNLNLDENEVILRFNSLSTLLGSEEFALKAVKNYANVLGVGSKKCKAVLKVFEGKWGFDNAVGVVVRNPSLFNVPVEGYGSAEVAGDDTVVVSYLIDITRPIGGPLLFLLFVALLKPFVAPLLFQ